MIKESFPPIKSRKGGKIFVLDCGHLQDTIFGPYKSHSIKEQNLPEWDKSMVYTCDLCDENKNGYPQSYQIKQINSLKQYLCWDCEYLWISDIECNKINNCLKCSNCGSLNKINNKKRNPIESRLRHECFKRDNYICVECGKGKEEITLHCDHINPVAQGGTDELDNLQTLCQACNIAKSNRKWVGDN